jgi:hypothetical protein
MTEADVFMLITGKIIEENLKYMIIKLFHVKVGIQIISLQNTNRVILF